MRRDLEEERAAEYREIGKVGEVLVQSVSCSFGVSVGFLPVV